MTAKLAWDYRIAAAFVGTALVALSAAVHAQQAEHPQLKVARADILRLVPDATITRLTRRGCSEDANARCMVCAVATIKGQERTGIVVVRQGSVEDNTFDPRQSSTKDAEAGIQAVCK